MATHKINDNFELDSDAHYVVQPMVAGFVDEAAENAFKHMALSNQAPDAPRDSLMSVEPFCDMEDSVRQGSLYMNVLCVKCWQHKARVLAA